ncbi:uncharacterized protein LOC128239278 isoform X3 [Mya arenaria]|uniref:uncharacterized protein LOC128239278 isoform X3 n=1 Tax=Mya arenaria TaxID=6604 RepID=UPI0022E2EB97|nr:uncharacterized protein LOC128239278 isoform X3 [Mya arenaria]
MEMMADADEQDLASELMVKFIGEDGVDAGGLRRELFSLVFEKTPLLDRNTFSNEACSLQHGEYIILGKLVSLTFIYGHPGLKTLHQTIIKYILNEKTPTTEIPLADVQNATVLRAIDTIQKASSKEEYMEAAIETSDLLERSGFNKPLTQDSSQSAVYTVKEYHIFYRCFGHIRQFMDGLKLHGVLDIMILHHQEATQFLGEATALTAEVKAGSAQL